METRATRARSIWKRFLNDATALEMRQAAQHAPAYLLYSPAHSRRLRPHTHVIGFLQADAWTAQQSVESRACASLRAAACMHARLNHNLLQPHILLCFCSIIMDIAMVWKYCISEYRQGLQLMIISGFAGNTPAYKTVILLSDIRPYTLFLFTTDYILTTHQML